MPAKILVVEDEASMTLGLRYTLELKGYEFYKSSDCEDAFQIAKNILPELIISDIVFPGGENEGFKLCHQLKDEPLTRSIPIIVLTIKNREEDRIKARDCGASVYMNKPFDVYELLDEIKRLVSRD